MAVSLYKQIKRSKKYYPKRALIFKMNPEHERQYRHNKNKSIIYQNTVFNRFGGELSFINLTNALTRTIDEFNTNYQDQIHSKHGILCLLIKHYTTVNNVTHFKAEDIFNYYPNIHLFFGHYHDEMHRSFLKLFNDLMHLSFINHLSKSDGHAPTMRLKHFCTRFDHHTRELFKEPDK